MLELECVQSCTCLLLLVQRGSSASCDAGCLSNKAFVHSEKMVAIVAT